MKHTIEEWCPSNTLVTPQNISVCSRNTVYQLPAAVAKIKFEVQMVSGSASDLLISVCVEKDSLC